jgi:hypothetical protein
MLKKGSTRFPFSSEWKVHAASRGRRGSMAR